jgi:hypothetical protein
MILLKGTPGTYLINPSAVEMVELEGPWAIVTTHRDRITVGLSDNLEALKSLTGRDDLSTLVAKTKTVQRERAFELHPF